MHFYLPHLHARVGLKKLEKACVDLAGLRASVRAMITKIALTLVYAEERIP